jgi:hypothetical protein
MQTFFKFGLGSIVIAALVACGSSSTPTAPTTPTASTAPPATSNAATAGPSSAALFIPASSTSKVIQFNTCTRTSDGLQLSGLSSPGGTITIAANGDITVAYTDSGLAAVGRTPGTPALNINRTFLQNDPASGANDYQNFRVKRVAGNTLYEFEIDRVSDRIEIYADSSKANGRHPDHYMRLSFDVSGTSEELNCSYAVDPALVANIPDYNARIASFTTSITGTQILGTDYNNLSYNSTTNSLTWRNAQNGVPIAGGSTYKYNAGTGIFGFQPSGAAAFTDFNTNTNMSSSSGNYSYQEYRESNNSAVEIYSQRATAPFTDNEYRFTADPATGLFLLK